MRMDFRLVIIGVLFTASLFAMASPSNVCGEEKEQTDANRIWVSGKVIWPDHDLTKASIEVFKDPKFKELYTRGMLLDPQGRYVLQIDDPGTYYIVAFVDDNGDNRFGAGDGMGIYGVTDWANPDQEPKPVQLGSGIKLLDIDIQVTAVVSNQGRMVPLSIPESGVTTGASGKLIWLNPPFLPSREKSEGESSEKDDEKKFSNAIVFAYSDPSWNNRIAQTNVKETGEYEISIPAGRYYLLAVIDENNTNLLDVGDKFGIWGMTKFGMFPKAVKVQEGRITENRNILIIGQVGLSGKPMPLQKAVKGMAPSDETKGQIGKAAPEDKVILSGNVIWPYHDVKSGVVQAYSDPSMAVAAASCRLEPGDEGRFQLAVPAGDYYIVAGVDTDGDGKYTTGDGIGAYGAADAAEQMPQKLTVTSTPASEGIDLVITAEFDESGQLKPISQYSAPGDEYLTQKPSIQDSTSSIQYTGISGKISWEGHRISKATLIFSSEPKFGSGIRTPLTLDDQGLYECSTPPGDYYLMAIMDLNNNDQVDTGDGIGFYGAGYWGAPQKVTVLEGRMTPFININITASFGPDGETTPVQTRGSIRFQYGKPDDVYTNRVPDRVTEEWWYWNSGVAFTFEETDTGWNLIDTYEFTPDKLQKSASEQQSEEKGKSRSSYVENTNGTLYYTFDKIIWAMSADGTNLRQIAPGTRPTATLDGRNLLFRDITGSIYLVDVGNDSPPQLVLSRRKAALQPALSHDGKVVAFTQDSGAYSEIILKNLKTGEESAIRAGAMDLHDPAWSPDSELIAYSASPSSSSSQQDRNRDIYYYDLAAGRAERVSMSPLDEFDPAWSSIVDRRMLVYCRAEGDHAQLWIVDFDADGKPIERQLTRYGGRSPTWSPKGDKIIYENNAQLWSINPDGSDERPVIVDGEPVFGMDPFWAR